jgi:hypothetical protein
VVNRVLSRSQKGFTRARQIQEVVINLSETIHNCKKNNIKGAMVCVDQAKAFDSVDHNFMKKTFKFFGFGDRFISWLCTIGMNRKACIIFDNGEKGNIFDLLRGTAQGDCPSPIIYNICAQILIFKIELTEEIRRVDDPGPQGALTQPSGLNAHPLFTTQNNPDFNCEHFFQTGKNESFADDSTTCTRLEFSDLLELKNILNRFAVLSGLKCNFEKTSLMRIGDLSGPIDQRILDLGFEIVEECSLLGFVFSNKEDLDVSNEAKLCDKIRKTIGFWTTFNLSISGKITVAKSLILPVYNYYGTVLNFRAEVISRIENMIEKFVTQGMNISKDKIYSPVEAGGLNLFRISTFTLTLQSYWIKRILDLQHDNWRMRAAVLSKFGIINLTRQDVTHCGPVLTGILNNFIDFRDLFGTAYNNFLRVPMLNNANFFYRDAANKMAFTQNFFLGPDANATSILDLTWGNLSHNFVLKDLDEINNSLNFVLDQVKYRQLSHSFNTVLRQFYKEDEPALGMADFLSGIKRGSKKLRLILGRSKAKSPKLKCPIKKFVVTVGIPDPEAVIARKLNARWCKQFYNSELRTFLFKLHHNILGINVRVAHYNPERSPECSFCKLGKNLPAERETISHFFWYCPYTAQSINHLFQLIFNFLVNIDNFFKGTGPDTKYSEALMIQFDLIKYILWLTKLRKRLPSVHSVSSDFFYVSGTTIGYNNKLNTLVTECNWLRRHGGDG